MENIQIQGKRYWALILGIFNIFTIISSLIMGGMSVMLFDAPGSEDILRVQVLFLLVLSIPLWSITACVTSFIFHKRNKYGTSAPIFRFFMFVPLFFTLCLIAYSFLGSIVILTPR